jgi:hypothetical protein
VVVVEVEEEEGVDLLEMKKFVTMVVFALILEFFFVALL